MKGSNFSESCCKDQDAQPKQAPTAKPDGSKMSGALRKVAEDEHAAVGRIIKSKMVKCPDDSEELACVTHLMLSLKI